MGGCFRSYRLLRYVGGLGARGTEPCGAFLISVSSINFPLRNSILPECLLPLFQEANKLLSHCIALFRSYGRHNKGRNWHISQSLEEEAMADIEALLKMLKGILSKEVSDFSEASETATVGRIFISEIYW